MEAGGADKSPVGGEASPSKGGLVARAGAVQQRAGRGTLDEIARVVVNLEQVRAVAVVNEHEAARGVVSEVDGAGKQSRGGCEEDEKENGRFHFHDLFLRRHEFVRTSKSGGCRDTRAHGCEHV